MLCVWFLLRLDEFNEDFSKKQSKNIHDSH